MACRVALRRSQPLAGAAFVAGAWCTTVAVRGTDTILQQTRALSQDSSATRLSGKGAIVTGGGTGIGRGVALALAAEGCDVIVTGRRTEPLEGTVSEAATQGLAGTISAFSVDAAEKDQTPLVEHALATFGGKLDILVNNVRSHRSTHRSTSCLYLYPIGPQFIPEFPRL